MHGSVLAEFVNAQSWTGAVAFLHSINKAHKPSASSCHQNQTLRSLKAYLTAKHLCDGVKSSFFRNMPRKEHREKEK